MSDTTPTETSAARTTDAETSAARPEPMETNDDGYFSTGSNDSDIGSDNSLTQASFRWWAENAAAFYVTAAATGKYTARSTYIIVELIKTSFILINILLIKIIFFY